MLVSSSNSLIAAISGVSPSSIAPPIPKYFPFPDPVFYPSNTSFTGFLFIKNTMFYLSYNIPGNNGAFQRARFFAVAMKAMAM